MGCGTSVPTQVQQQKAFEMAMQKALPPTTTRNASKQKPEYSTSTDGGDMEFRLQVAHSMPTWCIEGDCTVSQNEVFLLRASWRDVADGHGKPYQQAKELDETLTPLVHFYQTFYDMLFELIPGVRPKFKNNLKSQGMMLSKMVAFIVGNATTNDEAFRKLMIQLAARHNEYGIKAEWYSTQGLILIYAVRKCIGDLYTDTVHHTWIKLLTRMYRVILPTVRRGVRSSDLKDVKLYQTILEDSIYEGNSGKDSKGFGETAEEKEMDESIYKSPSDMRARQVQQQKELQAQKEAAATGTSTNPNLQQPTTVLARRNTHTKDLPQSRTEEQHERANSPLPPSSSKQSSSGPDKKDKKEQEEGTASETLPGSVPSS